MNFLRNLFRESVLRILVWASVISEILIVVTGGAVRLTASGLGCPTWPTCTKDSLVTVPAMGIHGIIEFSNRLLTFVLLIIAVFTAIAAFRNNNGRRLLSPALLLIGGIFVQAVVGGISVLAKLNPWVVGLHFVVSGAMIGVASLLLWRTYSPKVSTASQLESRLSSLVTVLGAFTIVIGIVVTGSGPHAGDINTPRNGLDPELWQRFHSLPAYLTLIFTSILLFLVRRRDVDGYASRLVFWTLISLILQAIVGITQAQLGLPAGLVILHLLLASTFVSLLTLQRFALRRS